MIVRRALIAFCWTVLLLLTGCEEPLRVEKKAQNQSSDKYPTTYRPNGTVEGCNLFYVVPRYGPSFQLAVCDKQVQTMTTLTEYCGKACSRTVEQYTTIKQE